MQKIEIITLHYIKNYGSVLQTYATQKKFELMGYECEVIDYIRPNAEEKEELKSGLGRKNFGSNKLIKYIYIMTKKLENKKKNKIFNEFLDKYINLSKHYSSYEELENNPPVGDIYCTGSDQTWNSEYNGGILPAYYLQFVPKGKKRIGYAGSIGMDSIPQNEVEVFKEYVRGYDAISVREDAAKKILNGFGITNVQHILDPTLILSKDEWKALIAPRFLSEKYILIYKLNDNELMEKYAEYLKKITGCRIIRMSYYLNHYKYNGKMVYTPKVECFLSLINNAEYILTDSFHCTAFSLNFEKEFFVFQPGKYNSRIQSILKLTKTEHRLVSTLEQKIKDIDYDNVREILNSEREKATDFIKKNCYIDKNVKG